jgi:hypothetical protein
MERVMVFKLSDGRLIENEALAIICQAEIDIKKRLSSLCKELFDGLDIEQYPQVIYNKRQEFLDALTNKS